MKTPYAISTKADGSMKQDNGKLDFENIERFVKKNQLAARFVSMGQVHGGNIAVVTGSEQQMLAVDGLITNTKNVSLVVVTADCLPILLYDPQNEAIAVAHAGSKGLLKNVIHNICNELEKNFQTDPKKLSVIIGPSIERDCYEVDRELVTKFKEQFPWFDNSFTKASKQGHVFLDLRKIALTCLLKEGILNEHVDVSAICTKHAADSFYSYRRGDVNGRFVSIISLL
jgi:YfiH family protein